MIGKTLQNILDEKNMKVSELSRLIGVSDQTLYSIIKRDNMKIDFEVLLKICDVLDVSIERFYSDYIETNKIKNINNYTNTEKKLMEMFRTLDSEEQTKIMNYIKKLAKSHKDQNNLKENECNIVSLSDDNTTESKTITLTKEQLNTIKSLINDISD